MAEKRERRIKVVTLKVLVVAIEGYRNDWAAYIRAVSGNNHDLEWRSILEQGNKLPRKVAEAIFPDFANDFVWRD